METGGDSGPRGEMLLCAPAWSGRECIWGRPGTGFDFCRRLRGYRQVASCTPKFALSCKVGRVDSAERARPVLRAGVAMGTWRVAGDGGRRE